MALCILLIYSTLYFVRPVCDYLQANTPFSFVVNSALMFCLLWLGWLYFNPDFALSGVKRRGFSKKISLSFFGVVSALCLVMIIILRIPEEKIHLLEYGVLAFLIFRALRLDINERPAFFWALVLGFLFGWGDEGIQYLLPNRYYQLKDVLLNGLGCVFGLAFTRLLDFHK